jgi:hypothetical protein
MSGGLKDFGKRWFVTIVMVPSIAGEKLRIFK